MEVLTHRAPDDLYNPSALRALLKDIREVRQAKIRTGLRSEDVIQGTYLNVSDVQKLCRSKSSFTPLREAPR